MNNDQQHQLGQVSFGQAVPLDRRFTPTDWLVLAVGIIAHALLVAVFLNWAKRQ